MDKWQKFLTEQEEPDETRRGEMGFETDCILLYDKGVRKQKYVLNSVREIAGVRIVNVTTPTADQPTGQAVGIQIKYSPVKKQELVSYLSFLKGEIVRIKGVVSVNFVRTNKVQL